MLGIYQMDECIGDCQICRHAITKEDAVDINDFECNLDMEEAK